MSSSTKSQGEVKRWHVILFEIIAGLLLLLVLFGSFRDLLLLPGQSGFPSVIHRWHEAQSGAFMTILFGGSLLALLWKPQNKPLLMQYLVLSIGIVCLFFATATGAGFMPIVLVIGMVFIAILAAAYPRPRDLIVGGSMAATRRPGWRAVAFIIGITYLYLGSMALLLPDYAGSWGTIGGVLGLLGGLSYIGVTLFEVQRTRRAAQVSPIGINLSHEDRQEAG